MVYLSSLRDQLTGMYTHPAILENAGREATDRALCHHHHQIFMEWLRLNLADQKSDLEDYLRSSGTSVDDLPYRELTPASAHEVERQLYLNDLEILLQLLRFDRAAVSLPGASRRR
jgi:hypothetical protein